MYSSRQVHEAPCGAEVDTGAGMPLVVNLRENIRDGYAETVTLTEDGRAYDRRGWHEGPDSPDWLPWIYVERWGIAGREFHGYVDPVSRKLTQAG
jgi:hypothetical protein